MRHTPGPWAIRGQRIESEQHNVGDIAHIYCKDVSRSVRWDEDSTAQANAQLIAAAPELLEACKALCEEWENSFEGQDTGFDDTALHEIVIMARHALLKAEGRNTE